MNVACFSVLSNMDCCKMVFSREQQVFIITHCFQNDPTQQALKGALVCNQHYLAPISCSPLSQIAKITCNDEYPLISRKYHLATFNIRQHKVTSNIY